MSVAIPHRKEKEFVTFASTVEVFREDPVLWAKRSGEVVYLHEIFKNPYRFYQALTKPVVSGNYKIKVISKDDLDNVNTGVEGIGIVVNAPLPPINISIAVKNSDVTLKWEPPEIGSVQNYKVYGNNGNGVFIDRNTVLATVNGSTFQTTLNSLANGYWHFVVESVIGGIESETLFLVHTVVPEDDVTPEPVGVSGDFSREDDENRRLGMVRELSLSRVSVAKVNIKFRWLYGNTATQFNVYHDDATGTIDFSTPKYSFNRQDTIIQDYTTPQLFAVDENRVYKFFVRPENSLGNEYGLDELDQYYAVSIEVDGVAPEDISSLSVDTTY